MRKITISHSSAIWLEHAQLINEAYKRGFRDTHTRYELRRELFNFHPAAKTPSSIKTKTDADEDLQENTVGFNKQEIIPKTKRKRKLKSDAIAEKHSDLETRISEFLQKIKEIVSLENSCAVEANELLPRYWEEQHEFPKFKGANSTEQFQSFSFGDKKYLIPPYCKFYNHNVTQLKEIIGEMEPYDLIVMDPPWRNKYIRRLKKLKLELAYNMLDNVELQKLPIAKLITRHTIVAIWCTNADKHQKAVLEKFLPEWNLCLVHAVKWLKISTSGELIGNINELGKKQPYEMLYITCHKETEQDFIGLKSIELIASIPSVVHSHKPPLLQWLQEYLPPDARCLELFSRYLQPQFTSIGLEVLKLMDERLYIKKEFN